MSVHSKLISLLLGVCLLGFQGNLLSQVSFTATISPGTIGKNGQAELRLLIENAGEVEQIIPPALKNFIIISGPNQESGMQSNNGITRQYIGITYLLQPKTTGQFTIGPAIARAGGKTFRSNKVTLLVNNLPGNQQSNRTPPGALSGFYDPAFKSIYKDYILGKGEKVEDKINQNIFIKVDTDKKSCYVGEPVVVTYKLYTRLKSESSIIKNPAFNGFSVIDLLQPGSSHYTINKLNGREYNVYTLRKSQLYPLQAGNAELESAEVENNIHFIKEAYVNREREAFNNMLSDFAETGIPAEGMQYEKVTLQNKPVVITVKPLPEKERPLTFNGAVGNFAITAALDKKNITTDDAGRIRITIAGEGNMTMINAPEVNWPAGIEVYELNATEQLDKLSVPVKGIKIFEYPFTITKPGNYPIPEISFSFFDVKQGKYKTIKTNPFIIEIKKGIGKKPVAAKKGSLKSTGRANFFDTIFSNRWLIVIPLAILILTGLFVWLQTDQKIQTSTAVGNQRATVADTAPKKAMDELPFSQLSVAEKKLIAEDRPAFYEALNTALMQLLAKVLQISLPDIDKKNIAAALEKKGIALDTCIEIEQLMEEINWHLYTPGADENKMEEMYMRATNVLKALYTNVR